jgi:hypothetical protein
MKPLKLAIAGVAIIFSGLLSAQVAVTIGTPPPWGPAEAPGIRFYYLPDIQMYFDVNTGEYVYFSGEPGFIQQYCLIDSGIMIFIRPIRFLFGIIMVKDHGKVMLIITETTPKDIIKVNIKNPFEMGTISTSS